MESYHASNSLSSGGYPDIPVRNSRIKNPYAYEVIPPIGRLLSAISDHCSVGGTIRPRNRTLAEWANYASAGHIAPLLDQLACDGWVLYDRTTGLITLLYDPAAGSIDPDADQMIPAGIISEEAQESALIPSRDRRFTHQNAIGDSDPGRDQTAQCMEDHVLVTTSLDSKFAVVESKIPCSGESIPTPDRPPPAAQLMAELGANPKIIRAAYAARADWSPQQVRDRWEYDQRRIAASDGRLTAGIFFTALRSGELAPDARPIDPQAYAGRDDVMLGSDPPPEGTIRDRALTLAGNPTAETLGSYARDVVFLQCRLGMGDSDADALQALEKHRKAVRR